MELPGGSAQDLDELPAEPTGFPGGLDAQQTGEEDGNHRGCGRWARTPGNPRWPFAETGQPGRGAGRAKAWPSAPGTPLLPHGCADCGRGLLPSCHISATSRTCRCPRGWRQAMPWTPACEQTRRQRAQAGLAREAGRASRRQSSTWPARWRHLASPEDGTLVQLVLRASAPDYVTWARACVQLPSRSQHRVKVESRGPEWASASAAPLAAGRFQLRLARGEALRGDRSAPASQSEGRRAGAARRSSAQNGNEVRLSQEALQSRSTSPHTAAARL